MSMVEDGEAVMNESNNGPRLIGCVYALNRRYICQLDLRLKRYAACLIDWRKTRL